MCKHVTKFDIPLQNKQLATSSDASRQLSITTNSGFFKLCKTMLNISIDYAKIISVNFSKSYIRKTILLDLRQKGSNYANIRLKIMSEKSLCQIYYATGRNYTRTSWRIPQCICVSQTEMTFSTRILKLTIFRPKNAHKLLGIAQLS